MTCRPVHPLYLRPPQYIGSFEDCRLFPERMYANYARLEFNADALKGEFAASLDSCGLRRPGFVDFSHRNEVVVQPGIRRFPRPDERNIALGLYLHQTDTDCWYARMPEPIFYPACVLPHFKDKVTETPIDWAVERLRVVIGYSVKLAGSEYHPLAAEYPYTVLAPLVCNSIPASLVPERRYALTLPRKKLWKELERRYPSGLTPEAAIFLFENDDAFTKAFINSPEAENFFKLLPRMLQNGLVIDRVTQLIKTVAADGTQPSDALSHALKLTTFIYGGQNEPWWFKEDFDLRKSTTSNSLSLSDRETIASYAGFAFEFAEKLFSEKGRLLTALDGVDHDTAIKVCCRIAADYGIGNPQRACNVLDYAVSLAEENSPSQRHLALERLLSVLHRQKPLSEVIGVLEGPEVNFSKPGLAHMISGLLSERAEKDKVDGVTIAPDHLRELANECARPLLERSQLKPFISKHIDTSRLLTVQPKASLCLPLAEEHKNSLAVKTPLTGWIAFDRALHEECAYYKIEKTAEIYFCFFAVKMPDPFRPPPGFLRFISLFDEIPDPTKSYDYLFGSRADRNALRQNAQKTVNRYLMVSTLLDAWVMGLIDWAHVSNALSWIIADIPAGERKCIEVEEGWKQYHQMRETGMRYQAAEDQELFRKLAALTKEKDWEKYCGEKTGWLEDQIRQIQAKRAQILREAEREKEYRSREERGEDAERDVGREVRRAQETVQVGRISRLQRVVESFSAINTLTACGVLESSHAGPILQAMLTDCLAGKQNELAQIRFEGREKEIPFLLQQMKSTGLFNEEVIRSSLEEIQQSGNAAGLTSFAEKIIASALAYDEVTKELKSIQTDLTRTLTESDDPEKAYERTIGSITEHLKRKLGLYPFITDGAVDSLLNIMETPRRYACVFSWHEQAKPVLRGMTGSAWKGLEGANQNTLSIWYLMRASLGFKQIQEQARIEAAGSDRRCLPSDRACSSAPATVLSRRRLPSEVQTQAEKEQILDEVPLALNAISRMRRDAFGLLPVGGKVHVLHEIDGERFSLFEKKLNLPGSYFRLIHANKSLILLPVPSDQELGTALKFLYAEGLIDPDYPELQISIPGRLPPRDCAYLGTSLLLLTDVGVRYNRDSFATTHDSLTGFRIMAYDAGGPRAAFPFDTTIKGRTDILGRRSETDIGIYQRLGTILVQSHDGGPFGGLALKWRSGLSSILDGYGLAPVLEESWVAEEEHATWKDEGLRHYEKAISPCTDAWFSCQEAWTERGEAKGVVFEARKLYECLKQDISAIQEELLENDRYAREKRELILA